MMTTNHISTKASRFADLAAIGEVLFHADDLANLWQISDKNTLYKTLSRYVKSGLLFRIYKGFYSLKDPKHINPYLLGIKTLHTFAYVSCESVLFTHSAIHQKPLEITLVSGLSKRYTVTGVRFRSRRLDTMFLYADTGITEEGGVRIASVSRAVADMLYFNPHTYFDAASSRLIDWQEVRAIAAAVGYTIHIPHYDSSR